jgi:hypothetical protein
MRLMLPWGPKARARRRALAAVREWQLAERREAAEHNAAVRRILEADGGWNAPSARIRTGPLLTRGQVARTRQAGR